MSGGRDQIIDLQAIKSARSGISAPHEACVPRKESSRLLEMAVRCETIAAEIREVKHVAAGLKIGPAGEVFGVWGEDYCRYSALAEIFKGAAGFALAQEKLAAATPESV
jgi:hypothetical protein